MGSLFDVSSAGVITSKGALLPTAGGIQTILDYNGDEVITFQMTGSVSPTFDFPVKFSRTGNIVVMQWDGFQKNTTNAVNFLFTADLVPARFLPSFPTGNPLVWDKTVIDGSSFVSFGRGNISFGPLGNIHIGTGFLGQNFVNSCCGILGGSITYTVY